MFTLNEDIHTLMIISRPILLRPEV